MLYYVYQPITPCPTQTTTHIDREMLMSTQAWVLRTDSTSAPPEGQTLHLHDVHVVETFYREDYNKLEEGLVALAELTESQHAHFPGFRRDHIEAGLQLVDSARYSLPYRSAGTPLGSIFNKDKLSANSILWGVPVELPPTVISIGFSLYQVLPSVIVLIVKARIDQSEDPHSILAATYEADWSGPGLHYVPEVLKTEAFRNHVWKIRRSIEAYVAKFFAGAFLGGSVDNTTGCPCCPAVEIYSLNSIPLSKCKHWLRKHHRFLSCMGVSWWPGGVFKSRKHLLFRSEIPEHTGKNRFFSKKPEEAWRIISSRWHYTGKRMPQGYTSPEFALVHEINYEIPDLLILTALQRLIRLDMKNVASTRDAIFADLGVSQVSGRPLQTTFSQLAYQREELDETRFRLERTKMELGDGRSVRGPDRMRFERIKPLKSDASDGLRQMIIDNILFLMSTFESEMKLLDRKLSTALALADRRLNLEIQARMDRFTKMGALAGAMGALAGIIGVIVAGISLIVTLRSSPSWSVALPTATPTSALMSATIIPQPTATITTIPTSTFSSTITTPPTPTFSPTPTKTTAPPP
jgi:hypothetical protein